MHVTNQDKKFNDMPGIDSICNNGRPLTLESAIIMISWELAANGCVHTALRSSAAGRAAMAIMTLQQCIQARVMHAPLHPH